MKSAALPSLERKPGGPDNWVEQTGGLPKYIERIAKHLHYERGYSISRSIAIAVNTVKRWARGGGVVKYGDRNNKHVSAKTIAQAQAALAEWEAKKATARALPGTPRGGRMGGSRSVKLSEDMVTLQALAARANAIADPERKAAARVAVLDLAMKTASAKPKAPLAKSKGRRPPYKFRHGFVPLTGDALNSKAKGSPVAKKTIVRKYGAPTGPASTQTPSGPRSVANAKGWKPPANGRKVVGRAAASTAKTGQTVSGDLGAVAGKLRIGQPVVDKPKVGGPGRQRLGDPNATPEGRLSVQHKPWDAIPDDRKIVRNGKRYILVNVQGKQQLAEWKGETPSDQGKPGQTRIASITTADAQKLSKGQLKKNLDTKGKVIDPGARSQLNAALRAKLKARKRT